MGEFLKSPGVDLLLLSIAYLAFRAMRRRLQARQDRRARASESADQRPGPADPWRR
jgi:hypothetical protein